jgi:hypothetical protein
MTTKDTIWQKFLLLTDELSQRLAFFHQNVFGMRLENIFPADDPPVQAAMAPGCAFV